jgi:5-methylcytosine-specific restriction enzyme A
MFTLSKDYDRNELLDFVGSKQKQSGIIWGNKEHNCVIITSGGRGGKSAGYGDLRNEDGSIFYIGQGESGDQDQGKFSNSLLVNGERTILFFSTREPNAEEVRQRGNYRKLYKFEGIFEVGSWDFYTPNEGKRANHKLLRFLLIPANSIYNIFDPKLPESPSKNSNTDLDILRSKINSSSTRPPKGKLSPQEYYKRSKITYDYAILRANGICEKCELPAPFVNIQKIPFLEVHHIFKLSDDGPDIPENVAAICPNCHREAHYGINKEDIKSKLANKILLKENALVQSSCVV